MIKLYQRKWASLAFLPVILFLLTHFPVRAQLAPEPFGKNRIQYKNFDWEFISTQNFNVYYYKGGKNSAQLTADYAEKELKRITSLIGYFPYSKTTLILYSSVADLRQSNIGLNDDSYQTGGETLFLKNKIEIAFEGSQTEYKKNLSLQVTKLLLNDMMYGGSLREVLQSSYMLRLPEWFLNGAAAYVAEGWNLEMDNYMRDIVTKVKAKKPETLFHRNPQLAGQAVWNYISERYGYTSIQNILNLTRITRDIEVGIASSLNLPYKKFMRDWQAHYAQLNTFNEPGLAALDPKNQLFRKNRKNNIYTQPVLSPDGSKLAYVENDRGRYQILVKNINRRGRTHTIKKGGFRTPDQKIDYKAPLLTWKSNQQLNIIEVKRGLPAVTPYYFNRNNHAFLNNLKTAVFGSGLKGVLSQFNQVLNIDYSDDGRMMVMAAVKNGQSDLFLFTGNARQPVQLTNDRYDDRHVVFLKGQKVIAFSSNRWLDSAGTQTPLLDKIADNFDLYVLNLEKPGGQPKRIVASISNELAPTPEDETHLLFLGEESGIRSLYRYNLATQERQKVTSFLQNIKAYDYNPTTKSLVLVAADRNKEFVYHFPAFTPQSASLTFKTVRQSTLEERTLRPPARVSPAPPKTGAEDKAAEPAKTGPEPAITQTPDTTQTEKKVANDKNINTQDYKFDVEPKAPVAKPAPARPAPAQPAPTQPAPSPPAVAGGQQPETLEILGPVKYDLRFSINKVVSSVYQDALMGFGIIAEVGMSDMFEDHRINGGAFIVTDLRTSNFYAEYHNLKKRYDLHFSVLKQTLFQDFGGERLKYNRQEFSPAISYPLSQSISFRVIPKLVQTRYSVTNILPEPDSIDFLASAGGELVYDNSVVTGVNMSEGTRLKAGFTTYKEMENAAKNFSKFYIDLRHYQKIHRQIIWANRLSYGQYFGADPKRFLLGGVNNWLFNSEDGDTQGNEKIFHKQAPIDLFYQEFATPMRGFNYNARQGSKYLLLNTELRIPVIQYLFGQSAIGSGFFRNLMFTAFSDIGSAYNGTNPFNRNNSYNTEVIGGNVGEDEPGADDLNKNPFQAIVVNYRNPFMFGYGVGARTTLLGLYGKFDLAWGEENYQRRGPKIYLSIGYDF
jgi:Tol biopolymer transport system component